MKTFFFANRLKVTLKHLDWGAELTAWGQYPNNIYIYLCTYIFTFANMHMLMHTCTVYIHAYIYLHYTIFIVFSYQVHLCNACLHLTLVHLLWCLGSYYRNCYALILTNCSSNFFDGDCDSRFILLLLAFFFSSSLFFFLALCMSTRV